MKRETPAIVALALVSSGSLASEPSPIPRELLDRNFLATRSWQNDSAIVSLVAKWPDYSGKQGFPDKVLIKQTDVSVVGVRFQAEYRVVTASSAQEIILLNSGEFTEQDCGNLAERFRDALGPPDIVADLTTANVLDKTLEWAFSRSRLRLYCAGGHIDNQFVAGAAVVSFRHSSLDRPLSPIIRLSCTAKRSWANQPDKTQDEPPFRISLDPNRERVVAASGFSIGKTTAFRNDSIELRGYVGSVPTRFELDRITGNYVWKSESSPEPALEFRQWGQCTKVSTDSRI